MNYSILTVLAMRWAETNFATPLTLALYRGVQL